MVGLRLYYSGIIEIHMGIIAFMHVCKFEQ